MKRVLADLLSYFRHRLRRDDKMFPVAPPPPAAEIETKPKRKHSGWKCMPYIIGNETFEKLAGAGLLANFTVYLVREFHMKEVKAVNVVNIFFGTTNFAPLIGAFLSDAYVGRYKTIAFSSIISFLGMLLLTLSAALPDLRPPRCPSSAANTQSCPSPSGRHLSVLYLSMALLIIGAGGIRPCSLPFGVDQFDLSTKKGEEDLKRFFNWYYFTSTLALFLSLTAMIYLQNSLSWSVGFAIPTTLMLLALLLFFLGSPLYVHLPPQGSVFSNIFYVFFASFRNRHLPLPPSLPTSPSLSFLNKAAISPLCSPEHIQQAKSLIRITPIWISGILCFTALAQQWTFSILQSIKMNRSLGPHFSIPPSAVVTVSMLGLALFIPIYDLAFVPVARRFTKIRGGITLLQRQGLGLAVSIVSMVAATTVERRRRERSLRGEEMSVLWLVPQLVVMGVAEAFNAVGQIEFYNRQFPKQMQTVAGSLFFCSLAGASYLSSLLMGVVRKETGGGGRRSWIEDDIDEGRLDCFYGLIAVLGFVNLIYFLVCASFYRYEGGEEVEEEGGGEGDVEVRGG